jgi:RNA polymerase sigma-70 factor (ECF subfamily)
MTPVIDIPRRPAAPAPEARQSDAELMRRVRDGDARAYDVLVRRHRPAVRSLARYACGPDLADDVMQAAFVSLWENRAKFDVDRGSVRAWLLAIVRHRGIDQLRMRATRIRHTTSIDERAWFELPDDGVVSEPAHLQVERAESGAQLHQALRRLPPDQRQVIDLAYFEGLSQQQIADRLGVPLGTVKGRSRLALGKLRSAWRQAEPLVEPRLSIAA